MVDQTTMVELLYGDDHNLRQVVVDILPLYRW
jgi:hypothetical protein